MNTLNKILNIMTAVGFVMLIFLMFYVINHAEAFKENPCKVCEEKHPGRMVCTQQDLRYIQKNINYGELNLTDEK